MDTSIGSKVYRTSFKYNRVSSQVICRALSHFFTLSLIISSFCLLIGPNQAQSTLNVNANDNRSNQQATNKNDHHDHQQQDQRTALEAELNSIVQQHDAIDGNNRLLADAIISRLMVDNLTGSNLINGNNNDNFDNEQPNELTLEDVIASTASYSNRVGGDSDQTSGHLAGPTGPEAMRLKKLLGLLQSYEAGMSLGGLNVAQSPYRQFPILPSSQAATMKRAADKMGSYLQQQQRQINGYGRNNFDFGSGKRPDSGNILRFGDSFLAQPVGQFAKRPGGHRYDFGLGKRVASPSYPRFDFGLGKRAPNRIRYDFGLGK